MCKEENKIHLTSDSELTFMSFHAREEAKNWTKISKCALNENIMIQAAVLSIYASELYLKSLLMILGVNALKECKGNDGHMLHLLFKRIPDENLKYSIASNVVFMCKGLRKKFDNREELLIYFEKKLKRYQPHIINIDICMKNF